MRVEERILHVKSSRWTRVSLAALFLLYAPPGYLSQRDPPNLENRVGPLLRTVRFFDGASPFTEPQYLSRFWEPRLTFAPSSISGTSPEKYFILW